MAKMLSIDSMIKSMLNQEHPDMQFPDIVNQNNCLSRELYLDIIEDVAASIEASIRFWNKYDDELNIPVEEREPIKIYIDSPGGSLTETFTMINAIEMSKTPVYTINVGCAYSGGFFTFLAGHKRFAYPLSSFLYHEGSTSNGGTAGQFANFAAFYKKQLEQIKTIVLKYSKIDEEKYKEIQKEDYWLTADEAKELGIVDEILTGFID